MKVYNFDCELYIGKRLVSNLRTFAEAPNKKAARAKARQYLHELFLSQPPRISALREVKLPPPFDANKN